MAGQVGVWFDVRSCQRVRVASCSKGKSQGLSRAQRVALPGPGPLP
jgi:hypothetical protein